MSMISEQVELLNKTADDISRGTQPEKYPRIDRTYLIGLLRGAASTIEMLSEKARKENGWIPCKNQMPKNEEDVLVFDSYGAIYIMYHTSSGNWHEEDGIWGEEEILAWRSLPGPYKEEDKT